MGDLLSSEAFWIVALIAVSFLGSGVFVLYMLPRGKLAELEPIPDEPFELRCVLPDARPHRLWLRYRVAYTDPGTRGWRYGLWFEGTVEVGGTVVVDTPIGLGGRLPDAVQLHQPTELLASHGRSGDDHTRAATVWLAELGPHPRGSEVVVRGRFRSHEDTLVLALRAWIGR